MKKYREFWITIDEMQDDGTARDYVYEQDPQGMFDFHVVEYSAYQKAQAEIESQSKLLFERDKRIDELKCENVKIKATQDKLVEELKSYVKRELYEYRSSAISGTIKTLAKVSHLNAEKALDLATKGDKE